MVGRRTCDQEVASSIPGQARLPITTLGKLFTSMCHTGLEKNWVFLKKVVRFRFLKVFKFF